MLLRASLILMLRIICGVAKFIIMAIAKLAGGNMGSFMDMQCATMNSKSSMRKDYMKVVDLKKKMEM